MGPLKIETADRNGEEIRFFNANPTAHRNNQPPLYLQPGWLLEPEKFPELVAELNAEKHQVIGVDAVHGIKPDEDVAENVSTIEKRQSSSIFWLMQQLGVSKVNAVGYSMGSLPVTAAAMHKPDKFHNVLTLNGSGFIGPDTFIKLCARHYPGLFVDMGKGTLPLWREIAQSLTVKYPHRTWPEGFAIAKSDIIPRIQRLLKQVNGVKVIQGKHDKTFPIDRVREQLKQAGLSDLLMEVDGTHYDVVFDQTRFAQHIHESLTELGE